MERKSSLSMEAVKFNGSPYQTTSPYNKRITNPFIAKAHPDNFMLHKMGILQTPPSFLSHSYPPYSFQQPPLPPLLPLPTPTNPRLSSTNRSLTHSLPVNYKINNTNNRPKKSNSFGKNPKKDEKNSPKRVTVSSTTTSLGSNTNKLQKDVKKVLPAVSTGTTNNGASTNSSSAVKVEEGDVGMFVGSSGVFTISPPPSSLPLPTFSLRPKLNCSTEASAVDTRATDNLRRILQLR